MRTNADRRALVAAALAALAVATGPVRAQAWPVRPIRIVVNFPPGGAADQIARVIAQPLQETLGQPVVVENRAGSGGNLGGDVVAKSAPDGYTLLMSSGGMVSVNPHIYARMPFNPAKDLVPVAAAARVLVFLVVRPEHPATDARAFLADLKAHPGKRSFGSPGNGSSPHLAAEMLKAQAGVFAVHVPYRGAAPALTDLMGGQLDFLFDQPEALTAVSRSADARRGGPGRLRCRHRVRLLRACRNAAGGREPAEPGDQPHPRDGAGEGAHRCAGRRARPDDHRAVPCEGDGGLGALRRHHPRAQDRRRLGPD
jgi:tripartite-type tricarboxylate transporter receptor subunit TctC